MSEINHDELHKAQRNIQNNPFLINYLDHLKSCGNIMETKQKTCRFNSKTIDLLKNRYDIAEQFYRDSDLNGFKAESKNPFVSQGDTFYCDLFIITGDQKNYKKKLVINFYPDSDQICDATLDGQPLYDSIYTIEISEKSVSVEFRGKTTYYREVDNFANATFFYQFDKNFKYDIRRENADSFTQSLIATFLIQSLTQLRLTLRVVR